MNFTLQYLSLRFSQTVRLMGSILFLVKMVSNSIIWHMQLLFMHAKLADCMLLVSGNPFVI
jgi:hypothetical protein